MAIVFLSGCQGPALRHYCVGEAFELAEYIPTFIDGLWASTAMNTPWIVLPAPVSVACGGGTYAVESTDMDPTTTVDHQWSSTETVREATGRMDSAILNSTIGTSAYWKPSPFRRRGLVGLRPKPSLRVPAPGAGLKWTPA